MISVPEIVLEQISVSSDAGEDLVSLARKAVCGLKVPPDEVGGVIAATFSLQDRFPSLAVRAASWLGLPASVPAFDLQMACSAYPYAVYLAGRLAGDIGKKIVVIDGDVQSRLVDTTDHATGSIFADACTATLVSVGEGTSTFDFLSRYSTDLSCGESGPIKMDGMKVFSFVATEVSKFLKAFGTYVDYFAPHQANPYMVRQLAKSLGLSDRLLTIPDSSKNPGSCSVPMAIAQSGKKGRMLIAGFGAGYSASAGIVRIA